MSREDRLAALIRSQLGEANPAKGTRAFIIDAVSPEVSRASAAAVNHTMVLPAAVLSKDMMAATFCRLDLLVVGGDHLGNLPHGILWIPTALNLVRPGGLVLDGSGSDRVRGSADLINRGFDAEEFTVIQDGDVCLLRRNPQSALAGHYFFVWRPIENPPEGMEGTFSLEAGLYAELDLMDRGYGFLLPLIERYAEYRITDRGVSHHPLEESALILCRAQLDLEQPLTASTDGPKVLRKLKEAVLAKGPRLPDWVMEDDAFARGAGELLLMALPRMLATLPDAEFEANRSMIERCFPDALVYRRGMSQTRPAELDALLAYEGGRPQTTLFLGGEGNEALFSAALATAGDTGRVVIVDSDRGSLARAGAMAMNPGRHPRLRLLHRDWREPGFADEFAGTADRVFLLYPHEVGTFGVLSALLKRGGRYICVALSDAQEPPGLEMAAAMRRGGFAVELVAANAPAWIETPASATFPSGTVLLVGRKAGRPS